MSDQPEEDREQPMLTCPFCGDPINRHGVAGCIVPKPAPERYCHCSWTPNGIAWWAHEHGGFVTR